MKSSPCSRLFLLITLSFFVFGLSSLVYAQNESVGQLKDKAGKLLEQKNYVDALPVLEKIAAAEPRDADTQFYLGFALLAKATHTAEKAEQKQLKMRARSAFIKAKELGRSDNLVDALIQSIPADGTDAPAFSRVPESNDATEAGERAFTQGKIDDALAHYKKALQLDPRNYHAALFSGDMYSHKNDFANAEIWFQKAIAIDPNIETAYRYSATPLMRQKKYDQARERYIEAWIVDPYGPFAVNGIIQWAQTTNTPLGHPKVDVPEITVGPDGKSNTTLNINTSADDGSLAWMSYVVAREVWRKEKFARAFPGEKSYRHTLQEEAEALREVVKFARTQKTKTNNEQIAVLTKLDNDGLLEAFILMAMPDSGIAKDHREYLRSNRDKLRQYVIRYVIGTK